MSEINVSATLKSGYTVENKSRSHTWLSDEPSQYGGEDLGPMPTELLLSALASCKLITMRMYAERKGWDFQGADITLNIPDANNRHVVEKSIQFKGDLDEGQIERLRVISGRCPVAKLLAGSIEFKFI